MHLPLHLHSFEMIAIPLPTLITKSLVVKFDMHLFRNQLEQLQVTKTSIWS